MNNTQIFTVQEEKIRLDKFLSNSLNIPRNQIEDLIRKFGAMVNNKEIKKCSLSLKPNDKVQISIPEKKEKKSYADVDFDIPIIYEDDDILVIDKPNNITVHRATSEKNMTVVDWLESKNMTLSTISGEDRNGIVHRLDKPTSGVMVIAKNNESHLNLSLQLKDRTMGRYYLAIINPILKDDITIDKQIGRSKNNRIKMATHNMVNPRDAKTTFKKLAISKNSQFELISARLHTGRTHQIRAHLQSIQRQVLGDKTYGEESKYVPSNSIFLQAHILYLKHPKNNTEMTFSSDLNKQMDEFSKNNFDIKEVHEKTSTKYILNIFEHTY